VILVIFVNDELIAIFIIDIIILLISSSLETSLPLLSIILIFHYDYYRLQTGLAFSGEIHSSELDAAFPTSTTANNNNNGDGSRRSSNSGGSSNDSGSRQFSPGSVVDIS